MGVILMVSTSFRMIRAGTVLEPPTIWIRHHHHHPKRENIPKEPQTSCILSRATSTKKSLNPPRFRYGSPSSAAKTHFTTSENLKDSCDLLCGLCREELLGDCLAPPSFPRSEFGDTIILRRAKTSLKTLKTSCISSRARKFLHDGHHHHHLLGFD